MKINFLLSQRTCGSIALVLAILLALPLPAIAARSGSSVRSGSLRSTPSRTSSPTRTIAPSRPSRPTTPAPRTYSPSYSTSPRVAPAPSFSFGPSTRPSQAPVRLRRATTTVRPSSPSTVIIERNNPVFVPIPQPMAPAAPIYVPSAPVQQQPVPVVPAPAVNPVVAPTAAQQSDSGDSPNWGKFLLFLLVGGGLVAIAYYLLIRPKSESPSYSGFNGGELTNDRMTVISLSVAVPIVTDLVKTQSLREWYHARREEVDTSTTEGGLWLVKEVAMRLLRVANYIDHAHIQAEKASLEGRSGLPEAQAVFDRFSSQERARWAEEVYSNLHGGIQRRSYQEAQQEPGKYWIVNMILATEKDNPPLPEKILNFNHLQETLRWIEVNAIPTIIRLSEINFSPEEGEALSESDFQELYPDLNLIFPF